MRAWRGLPKQVTPNPNPNPYPYPNPNPNLNPNPSPNPSPNPNPNPNPNPRTLTLTLPLTLRCVASGVGRTRALLRGSSASPKRGGYPAGCTRCLRSSTMSSAWSSRRRTSHGSTRSSPPSDPRSAAGCAPAYTRTTAISYGTNRTALHTTSHSWSCAFAPRRC